MWRFTIFAIYICNLLCFIVILLVIINRNYLKEFKKKCKKFKNLFSRTYACVKKAVRKVLNLESIKSQMSSPIRRQRAFNLSLQFRLSHSLQFVTAVHKPADNP